jgi:hypothetical protein
LQPLRNGRIVPNSIVRPTGLEEWGIGPVIPQNCWQEAQVCFGKAITAKKGLTFQDGLASIEALANLSRRSVVGSLSGAKPAAVNSIVEQVVYPLICGVNFGCDITGIQVQSTVLRVGGLAEGRLVEHADNVGRFVGNDLACSLVNEKWCCASPLVARRKLIIDCVEG